MSAAQNEIPFRELSAEQQHRLLISLQANNLRDAKTPEGRDKAEAMLAYLREVAKWRFVRELPPLFRLYQHEDGRWRADLSPQLEERALSLRAKTHSDKDTEAIAQAINALAALSGALAVSGTLAADALVKACYEILQEKLLPRLRAIMLADPASRQRLGKKLKGDLAHGIDQLVAPEGLKPRANASLVSTRNADGQDVDILLEEVAIEGARSLAQQDQALPTKLAVRKWFEEQHTETVHLSETKWTSLWRNAGLESLPEASAWARR